MTRLALAALLCACSFACADPLTVARAAQDIAKAGRPEKTPEQQRDEMLDEIIARKEAQRAANRAYYAERREKAAEARAARAAAEDAEAAARRRRDAEREAAAIAEAQRRQRSGEDLIEVVCLTALDILDAFRVLEREDAIAKTTGATNAAARYRAGQQLEQAKVEIASVVEAWERRFGRAPDMRTWSCDWPEATEIVRGASTP